MTLLDLRSAARNLARMRAAGSAAVLTIAIGIAAMTTMFSVVYAALLRPLPFHDADRLAVLFLTQRTPRDGLTRQRWSWPDVVQLQRSLTSFESVASHTPVLVAISGGQGEPEQIDGEVVSAEYWRVLNVRARHGRVFTTDDDGQPIILISARLWRQRFSADPALVGRTFRVNDMPLTVIGILPEGFSGLSGKADLWIAPPMAARLTYADYLVTPQKFISIVGRLKPNVGIDAANAELGAIAHRFVPAPTTITQPGTTWSSIVVRINDVRADPILRRSALALLGASACVLLIACVNVACLLLARASTRRREIAVRLAIGSGRGRIVRQLLTEGFLISALGGAGGVLLALWGVKVFARTMPEVIPTGQASYLAVAALGEPALDARVLLFSLAITVATTLLSALAPALRASRPDLTSALKAEARGIAPRGQALSALITAEMALATLLLVGSGWLIDTFMRIQDRRAGFNAERVVTFWVRPPVSRYDVSEGPAVVERLVTRVQAVPGVETAAVNRCTPFTGCASGMVMFADRPAGTANRFGVGRHYVSADYFATLGIPVLAGRALRDSDRLGAPLVAVINEGGARRFWSGESPLGKRIRFITNVGAFADPEQTVEIVGVVGDVKYGSVDQLDSPDRAELYTSYHQFSWTDTMMLVKARSAPGAIVPALRQAVASFDPSLPIYDVLTLEDRIDAAVARPRFNAALLAIFAGVALLLAAIGVYGVLSYSVSARAREIGVRLALGAPQTRVAGRVLGGALRPATLGACIGLAGAAALMRVLRRLDVFGQSASVVDPRLYAAVIAVLMVIARVAALIPAGRAARVYPLVVLRQ
jgi:putative ABC transport system permease protein